MRETMDRLIVTTPDLFALEPCTPLGKQVEDHEPDARTSIATNEESELSAAGREDGGGLLRLGDAAEQGDGQQADGQGHEAAGAAT